MFNTSRLNKFFYPKSIAVVGASNDISKIGGYIFSQILKKSDIKAYPINIKNKEIQNTKAYLNIYEIKKKVDLVIIAIPGKFVLNAISDCIKAKCKNIVIISAGFKEASEEGKLREIELKKLVREHDLNLIGPNCLGISNPEIGLNCSFAKDLPQAGEVALISQSGAVVDAIIDWSFKHRIGFSKIVSLGNMAGVDELEMLEYLNNDPNTSAIVFYMETLEQGEKFGEVLRKVSKRKPIIIIKPGKSENAKSAIGSHTGSLAQDSFLVETLIEQNNGILVKSVNELFNILIALKGNISDKESLVILTNAGGPGVIATDVCAQTNFELYKFTKEKKEKFKFLPNEASTNNPIDILGDAKSNRYFKTLQILNKNKEVNNILVLLTPQIMTNSLEIAKKIVEISKKSNKNIFCSFLGDKEVKHAKTYLELHNIPSFETPSEALTAMNYLCKYQSFSYEKKDILLKISDNKIKKIKNKLKVQKGLLNYDLTNEVLKVVGVTRFEKTIIKSEGEIFKIKLNPNKDYVLKAQGILHKKDVGGVEMGINCKNFEEKAANMFEKLGKNNNKFKISIEEEVSGTEVICGLKRDEELGNFIMFGMGGTYVSIIKDVNLSQAPLTPKLAEELVQKSKVYEILKGFRGTNPINFSRLYNTLVRISYIQEVFEEIKEVDFNPIICNENDVYLVDVKFLV